MQLVYIFFVNYNLWIQVNCVLMVFIYRWLKFEEDVEDGGERWSKPYVATLSLHSLFELRSCILNGTVMLDMRANSIEEIAGTFYYSHFKIHGIFLSFHCISYVTL